MANLENERQQPNRFLVPIQEYESPASRIKGFQELFIYGLRAPKPMFVVGHQAFLKYETSGELIPPVEEEIGKAYEAIRQANPERGAYIGRAFYVPVIDNPNGPRTAAIRDKGEYLQEVTKFWDFVIENGYNVPDADIALVLHPFIHVMDPPRTHYGNLLLEEGEQLPYGAGYLVPYPQPDRPNLIRILGIFGTDEAVVSCPHDVYDVDPDTDTITAKRIAFKDITYVPGYGNEYGDLPIPLPFQNVQALTDKEILSIACDVKHVLKNNSVRIEFATQADETYYREIAPWKPLNPRELLKLQPKESVTGSVTRIASADDVNRVSEGDAIVYFPPESFRIRTTDLFTRTALLPHVQRMVALTHGTIETSHMVRILSDTGRSVVLVGDQEFENGTLLKVSRGEDGLAQIELLNPYENAIIPFADVRTLMKEEAGQKVARLAQMRHAGIQVPDGFGLRSKAVWQYLSDIGLRTQITALDTINLQNQAEIEEATQIIQKAILNSQLPPNLEQQINLALKEYGFNSYAIRSSGSEDGENQSRAGLFESSIDVKPEDVSIRVKKTIASYFSPASIIALRSSGQLLSRMTIGVGIHEFIPATEDTVGAVVFSSPKSVLVEATQQSPEGIVSGMAKDYLKITISRASGEIEIEQIGNPAILLTDDQIQDVAGITKQIEDIFKSYQDIELIVTPDRGIVVVQARPL